MHTRPLSSSSREKNTGKEDRKELQSTICLLIYLDTIFQASVRATDHKPANLFLPCIRDYAPELRPALATVPPQKGKLPQPLFSACPSHAQALSVSSPSVTVLVPLPGLAAEMGRFGNRYTEGQVPHQGHTGCSVPLTGGWEPGDILESSWVLATFRMSGVCICLLHRGKSEHKKKRTASIPSLFHTR